MASHDRWCFYINLPIGGLVLVFVFFFLDVKGHPSNQKTTLREKISQFNLDGLLTLLPGVICLCLALEWGGFVFSVSFASKARWKMWFADIIQWSNGRITALLVLAFFLLIVFVIDQLWRKEKAIVPPQIFAQRSIAGGFWVSCCVGAHQTLYSKFLTAFSGLVHIPDAYLHVTSLLLAALVPSY